MDILCIDFVNSQWYVNHKTYKEMLYDNEHLMDFFSKRNIKIDVLPDDKVIKSLLSLRSILLEIFKEIVAYKSVSDGSIEKINKFAQLSVFVRKVKNNNGTYILKNEPICNDWNWVMSEIANSFMELICVYDLKRIKICENPECGWFFYDESKSRTKRWCDESCGNLMKVRRFRAKQKNV